MITILISVFKSYTIISITFHCLRLKYIFVIFVFCQYFLLFSLFSTEVNPNLWFTSVQSFLSFQTLINCTVLWSHVHKMLCLLIISNYLMYFFRSKGEFIILMWYICIWNETTSSSINLVIHHAKKQYNETLRLSWVYW